MSQPSFSIVLLAHNSAWCIRDALESVVRQSVTDWECIICDDASTDETFQVTKPFLADQRFKYHAHAQNMGQPANWSFGIEAARSECVATLHADDVWLDNALAVYHEGLSTAADSSLVLANYERCNEKLSPLAHQTPQLQSLRLSKSAGFEFLLKLNFALPSASAFRRDLTRRSGLPFGDYGMLCDRDFLLRLAAASPLTVIEARQVAKYRVHSQSVTNEYNSNGKLTREMLHFDQRISEIAAGVPDALRLVHEYRRGSAEYFFRTAMTARVANDRVSGSTLLWKSIKNNPRMLLRPAFALKFVLFWIGRKPLSWVHGRNNYVTSSRDD